MPVVGDMRKCRVQGCQRSPVFPEPDAYNVNDIAREASHCAEHRESLTLRDDFLVQNGVVVHNTNGGSGSASRGSVGKGNGGSTGGSNVLPATSSRWGVQARGGARSGAHSERRRRGGGSGGSSGGSTTRRPSPRSSTCQVPGCTKSATYGDGLMPTRCTGHKEKGQVDHKHRQCEHADPLQPCLKQPSFGWPGESRKRFCGAHRKEGTVDLRNCEHEGCSTRASHGFKTGRARFCGVHSPPGTSVLANKPCEKEGCTVAPRFGNEGERPRFCGSHKEKQMVNLKDRRCECSPCKTQPTFAFPGEKPRFCSKHKSEGHVNVRHKLCRHLTCKVVPTYGPRGTRVPVSCLEHSDGDMVDLKRERMRISKAKVATAGAATSSSRAAKAAATRARAVAADTEWIGARTASDSTATTSKAVVSRRKPPPLGRAIQNSNGDELEGLKTLQVLAGGKRLRATTQSLGRNAGVGRKIAKAIFASSQQLPEAGEALAAEESEWEEASEEGDEEEEDEEEDEHLEGDDEAGTRMPRGTGGVAQVLPPVLAGALPAPPTERPIAMRSRGEQRHPLLQAPPLAVLPVGRSSLHGGSVDHTLETGAARLETRATTAKDREKGNQAAGKREGTQPVDEPPPAVDERRTPTRGEQPQQQQIGDLESMLCIDSSSTGTSLTWSCSLCMKAVAPGDRHVLMCCGYGVLHKACTAVFIHGLCPCTKCFRMVGSSMQVFL